MKLREETKLWRLVEKQCLDENQKGVGLIFQLGFKS